MLHYCCCLFVRSIQDGLVFSCNCCADDGLGDLVFEIFYGGIEEWLISASEKYYLFFLEPIPGHHCFAFIENLDGVILLTNRIMVDSWYYGRMIASKERIVGDAAREICAAMQYHRGAALGPPDNLSLKYL